MLKLLFNSWVKNVNNQRMTSSKSSVCLYTKQLTSLFNTYLVCLKPLFKSPFLNQINTTKSTTKIDNSTLLSKSFTHYPQSLLLNLLKEN